MHSPTFSLKLNSRTPIERGSNMQKKLIIFDIDGTLYNDEKQLPASTKEAIQTLQGEGHEIAIATGRSPFNFKDLREVLNINTFVGFNGQYVVRDDEIVYKNPVKRDLLEQLTVHARKHGHPLIYMDHEGWYSNVEEHAELAEAIDSLKVNNKVGFDPSFYENNEIYQTLLFCKNEHEAAYKEAVDQLDFVRWHQYSVDVLPLGGSKAMGIENLVKHLGVSPEHVYAFGDGLNDVEMLTYVHNSVAMGNGHDLAKKAAKFVTKDVGEDGILHGLQLVGLLK